VFFRPTFRGYVSYVDTEGTRQSFWVLSPAHVYAMGGEQLQPAAYSSLALPQADYWGLGRTCSVTCSKALLGSLVHQLCTTFAGNHHATLLVLSIPIAALLIPRLNPADNPLYVIWGPPSTGKTTLIRFLLEMLGDYSGLKSGGKVLRYTHTYLTATPTTPFAL
jgi:hypothetical protein